MEVTLPPELQAKLSDEWFLREVERSFAAAERDEFIEHEDVGKLIESRYPG